ncbi:MAG TPA: type III pantothenate kinase [Planctomycetota bacterium]|nr:type III pantothenate kinase [Planctomycetota bacterium]
MSSEFPGTPPPPPDLITINIGNTHTSATGWSFDGEPGETLEWQSDFKSMQLVAKHAVAAQEIVIGSVVKQCTSKLLNDLSVLGRKALCFRTDLPPRIEIVPLPAERVGDDRLAAALGALDLDDEVPWIVVDAGTAVTCNAVTPARGERLPRFEGGLIFPGAALSLKSLNQGTAQLPDLKSGAFEKSGFDFIGRSTEQAMLFGVLALQASGLLAMIEGQRSMLGAQARVAFTGGGAGFLIEALRRSGGTAFDIVYQPTLVHRGLFAACKAAQE